VRVCRRYNPIKTIKTSFIGTMNMLGLAKRTRARFLLTSTSEARSPALLQPRLAGCGQAEMSSLLLWQSLARPAEWHCEQLSGQALPGRNVLSSAA
jgi:nucleoside-diphosphate-sugar epimerase